MSSTVVRGHQRSPNCQGRAEGTGPLGEQRRRLGSVGGAQEVSLYGWAPGVLGPRSGGAEWGGAPGGEIQGSASPPGSLLVSVFFRPAGQVTFYLSLLQMRPPSKCTMYNVHNKHYIYTPRLFLNSHAPLPARPLPPPPPSLPTAAHRLLSPPPPSPPSPPGHPGTPHPPAQPSP